MLNISKENSQNRLFQKKSVKGGGDDMVFFNLHPRIFRIFTPGQRDFHPPNTSFFTPGHGKITPWTQNFTPGQRFLPYGQDLFIYPWDRVHNPPDKPYRHALQMLLFENKQTQDKLFNPLDTIV